MKFLLAAPAFLLLAASANAQTGDWPRVQSIKRGTMLVIETEVSPYGPASFTRCRMQRADAAELTCTDLNGRTRFTFPMGRIDAVYQVKQRVALAVLGAITVGCFLGGLASANAPLFVVGVMGGIIWGIVALNEGTQHQIDIWTGAAPNPLPDHERRVLVYIR